MELVQINRPFWAFAKRSGEATGEYLPGVMLRRQWRLQQLDFLALQRDQTRTWEEFADPD